MLCVFAGERSLVRNEPAQLITRRQEVLGWSTAKADLVSCCTAMCMCQVNEVLLVLDDT